MILYHGTYTDFQEIELDKCSPYKDFGKGFYLTDILEQADAMAQKKSRIYGGSPIVQKYEFKEDVLTSGDLNVLVFEKPTFSISECNPNEFEIAERRKVAYKIRRKNGYVGGRMHPGL